MKKNETYVLMYATLEANSQCNKKREREKGRLKNCGSTARQPDRQTEKQECMNATSIHASLFFLMVVLLLYSLFVLFSLERTFYADKTSILFFFII